MGPVLCRRHWRPLWCLSKGLCVAVSRSGSGGGSNTLQCELRVLAGDLQVGESELLHVLARAIRMSRGGDVPDPSVPYPRPNAEAAASSRSSLSGSSV